MAYTTERKMAKDSSKFGKGDLRGLAAPESANNAAACGSFVPMLTLGVPGSGTTAGHDGRIAYVQHRTRSAVICSATCIGVVADCIAYGG